MSVMAEPPAIETISQHIDRFLFVRSIKNDNASVRIHTIAAGNAIDNSGAFKTTTYTPDTGISDVPPRTCLLFYYADDWAIEQIRSNKMFDKAVLSLCFGSDIKTYGQYQNLSDIVDCFLMPSQNHADILALGLMNGTAVVRESIDPFFASPIAPEDRPINGRGRNVVWFGYAESFLIGMDPLLGVVQQCLKEGYIDRFAAVLNRRTLDPRAPAVEIIEYSSDTIIADIRSFDYALLSHIPGDLHINSLIKSPNKVISTLASGLVPLASGTPNYRETLTSLGLERFLFQSPFDLLNLLRNLDAERDRNFLSRSGVRAKLQAIHSLENIFGDLMAACARALEHAAERRQVIGADIGKWEQKSFVGFGDHARSLIPSAIRAATMRVRAGR